MKKNGLTGWLGIDFKLARLTGRTVVMLSLILSVLAVILAVVLNVADIGNNDNIVTLLGTMGGGLVLAIGNSAKEFFGARDDEPSPPMPALPQYPSPGMIGSSGYWSPPVSGDTDSLDRYVQHSPPIMTERAPTRLHDGDYQDVYRPPHDDQPMTAGPAPGIKQWRAMEYARGPQETYRQPRSSHN